MHPIFQAQIGPVDKIDSIRWEQLTNDPNRHNIRPIVVSDQDQSAILWLRGQYNTYTDYFLDVVGVVD